MVIYRYRQNAFRLLLANHVLVQDIVDLLRNRQLSVITFACRFLNLFANDVVAQVDTLITYEYRRPGNELPYLVLAFATKRAIQQLPAIS